MIDPVWTFDAIASTTPVISQISDTSISMSIVYCGNQMTAKEILMNGRSHDDGRSQNKLAAVTRVWILVF